MEFSILIDRDQTFDSACTKENTDYDKLYRWQTEFIKEFIKLKIMLLSASTGAGKSRCAIEIIKKVRELEPGIKILIVCPKNIIMEDTWYRELYANGISLPDIGIFYGKIKEISKVTLTNMQSVLKLDLSEFGFLILDECHNYQTDKLTKLFETKYKYMLGMSATVDDFSSQGMRLMKMFDYNVYRYDIEEALQEKILSPFLFYNYGVTMDFQTKEIYEKLTTDINTLLQAGGGWFRITRKMPELKIKLMGKMLERKKLVNNYEGKFEIVKNIIKENMDKKVIIFNEFNSQTTAMYWQLLDIGVKAVMVHSGLDAEKREQNLMNFRNDRFNIMLATKVLDEGWNIPSIDLAIIMAGNSTKRQTIQRIGRSLRKKAGKEYSNIYQIYVADTIEEDYANKRASIFKALSINYEERVFT